MSVSTHRKKPRASITLSVLIVWPPFFLLKSLCSSCTLKALLYITSVMSIMPIVLAKIPVHSAASSSRSSSSGH